MYRTGQKRRDQAKKIKKNERERERTKKKEKTKRGETGKRKEEKEKTPDNDHQGCVDNIFKMKPSLANQPKANSS